MTKFDISNFINIENVKTSKSSVPEWVLNSPAKVKEAYKVALKMFVNIQSKIKENESLSAKERKLVLAQIAKEIAVDRSYLTNRRTPLFCSFVNELNSELNTLWKLYNSNNSHKKISKDDLKKEAMRYKKLYEEECDKNYSDAITKLLESQIYGSSKQLRKKYQELELENKQLNDKISNLHSRLRFYTIKEIG